MGFAGTYGKQGSRTVDPSCEPDVDPSYEIGREWFRTQCDHDDAVDFSQSEELRKMRICCFGSQCRVRANCLIKVVLSNHEVLYISRQSRMWHKKKCSDLIVKTAKLDQENLV